MTCTLRLKVVDVVGCRETYPEGKRFYVTAFGQQGDGSAKKAFLQGLTSGVDVPRGWMLLRHDFRAAVVKAALPCGASGATLSFGISMESTQSTGGRRSTVYRPYR